MKHQTNRNDFHARYRVWGNSHVITVAPELRRRLGLVDGDWLMVVLDGDVMILSKVRKADVFHGKTVNTQALLGPEQNTPRGGG